MTCQIQNGDYFLAQFGTMRQHRLDWRTVAMSYVGKMTKTKEKKNTSEK